ncbi:MAG: TonB-dependent receptor [Tannerellaceae bacterium]|jgi:TonB-linked SusC/RagA family outer membrane protein|nr:TonB-dependent receptor [Tannerellaceae bacterium]
MIWKQMTLGLARAKTLAALKKWVVMLAFLAPITCNAVYVKAEITQQQRKITGKVLSKEDNETIIGASVQIEGTNIGTATDINGEFTIPNVPADARQLRVSYVGMKAQLVAIAPNVTVHLESDAQLMDEVIVVAYGAAKKGSFTGAASSIKVEQFEERPMTNVTSALLGTTPGVQVSTAAGQPGSESSIYIRGIGSVSASNTPLIVLNGMPYDNAISSINPNDIESMTVLKDASSAALYGARGGNGVILINTKSGNKDKTTVNVKINQGVTSRQSADYQTLGVADYLMVYWESWRNKNITAGMEPALAGQTAAKNLISDDLGYNPFNVANDQVVDANGKLNPNAQFMWGDDTDWTKAIQQMGNRTDASMNISGGNTKSDYYMSVGYLTEEGYIVGSKFDRYTMNTNVNSQITSFLKVGGTLSGNISNSVGEQNEASGGNSNPFRFSRYIGPIYPIHVHHPVTKEYIRNANGGLVYDFGNSLTTSDGVTTPSRPYIGGNNPVVELQNLYNGYKRNTLNAKAYAEIRFLDGFKLTLNGAVGANSYLSSSASIVYPELGNSGSASKTNSFTTTWTYNQLLSYSKNINKHHFDALLGHESYDYEYNNLSGSMQDQNINDDNYEFGNYATPGRPNSYTNTYRTEGYLARFNYDFDDRYFLSASVRRDGSSRFHKDSRWGTFYSVGAGWRIDEEKFMKSLTFVDMLKLRLSYGEVGNDEIGTYYAWQSLYAQAPNGLEGGYLRHAVLNNRSLQWEVSHSSDAALEFELFKSRLSGSIELFNRQSSNLLFSIPQSPSTGLSSSYRNAGNMYNRGVEIDLHGKVFQRKDLSVNLGVNATFLKNEITYLPVEPYIDGTKRVEEGHSRYEFYLRQWAGVDPATGNSIYVPDEETMEIWNDPNATQAAKDALKIVTVDGKTYTTLVAKALRDWSGVATPSVSGGITAGVSYKGISLNLLFNYQLGGKYYDAGYADLMAGPSGSALPGSNRHVDILNRWQKPGDVTDVPRIEDFGDTNMNAGTSTRWLVSSDMLELANVTLNYDIPKSLLKPISVQGLRVYASADNLLLFTARQGIYPRRAIFSGYNSNPDVYLPARVLTLGLNLTF